MVNPHPLKQLSLAENRGQSCLQSAFLKTYLTTFCPTILWIFHLSFSELSAHFSGGGKYYLHLAKVILAQADYLINLSSH